MDKIDKQIDDDYKFMAMITSLENALKDFEIPKSTVEAFIKEPKWMYEWASVESGLKSDNIPEDREKLYQLFRSVAETIPTLNGSTPKFVESMIESYEFLTRKYNPIIGLKLIHRKYAVQKSEQYNT